jgi:hypothetical protein
MWNTLDLQLIRKAKEVLIIEKLLMISSHYKNASIVLWSILFKINRKKDVQRIEKFKV